MCLNHQINFYVFIIIDSNLKEYYSTLLCLKKVTYKNNSSKTLYIYLLLYNVQGPKVLIPSDKFSPPLYHQLFSL